MTNRKDLTWGDVFEDVAAASRPTEDRAALAAAHFATLREVLAASAGKTLALSDLFEQEAA